MTKKTIILISFILLKFLLQYLLFDTHYDLHRDEYLHLDQANHPAWGYLSVPPVTSWISYLIQLLGNGVFWVKFFPALFGALTILVVWKTIEELQGNLYALILGATAVLLSAILRINFLFQPNSLDVLCWTAFYYSLIRYFNNEEQKWLYIAAVIFAIGFLNKYNILFLLIGLVPALAVTDQRKVFTQRNLYLSVLLSLILISANVYWQYTHDFPVFHHMKVLTETQLIHVNRWLFLKEQLFYFVGALPVIIASLYATLFYEPFKKYRFFFWALLFTLATFTWLRAKGYYAIGLYPIYIALGSVFLGNTLQSGWKRYLRIPILGIPILFYALLFRTFFSIAPPAQVVKNSAAYQKLGLLRWEDGKDHALPQDYADMNGWKELAAKVEIAYNKLPEDEHTIVLCDNYGEAGAINYYAKNKQINAVSFNADYINWFNLKRKTTNLIRIKEFKDSGDELAKTSPFFTKSFIADSITNPYAREFKTAIFVFTNAKIEVNERLKAEIEKEK